MVKFGIGQAVRRVEDARFLKGSGQFVDDIAPVGLAYGAVVLSPQAHARITRIDATAARAAPGVLDVLTAAEVAADKIGGLPPLFMPDDVGGPKSYRTRRPILCGDRVRCVGDRVAFVVAESEAEARNAAELIEIEYDTLPAVAHVDDAVAPGAPAVWDDCPSNVSFTMVFGDKTATDAAFAGAAHTVRLRLENNRLSANALEPRTALGQYDRVEDRYTLHTSSQHPFGCRQTLAAAVFGEPVAKFRVVAPDVGGGFGMKSDAYPEDALVLWASRRLGRPVKWVGTRAESLAGDYHGRDQVITAEMALDAGGRILGLRTDALNAVGAYTASAMTAAVVYGLRLATGTYDIAALHATARAVFTNTSPIAPYRGAGRPEAAYTLERLLDAAARKLGLAPDEIRRLNFIKPAQMPYATRTGYVFDSGEFETCMTKVLANADWAGFAARKAESERRGLLRGRGIASFIEEAGIFNERMDIRFDAEGNATILAGTHSHGQGHATTFAQIVHELLGIPFESIRFVQGDTDKLSVGRGTYASRSVMVGGCALKVAADDVVAKGRRMAAHLMEARPEQVGFADGLFRVEGTNRTMPLVEVAKAFFRPVGVPREMGVGLEGNGSWASEPGNFPNGCHACEVEIDPRTGHVEVVSYHAVDDLGRVINPMIVEGQVQGGLAQGLGQALFEHAYYDRETGQLVAGSFMDYAMPRADDFPIYDIDHHDVPCTTNPLGVKGTGEAGTTGGPPAVMNAILDALAPLGVTELDMPATPYRVWQAIEAARVARAA